MRDFAEKVCQLQAAWSDRNTPEMRLRGELVRSSIPAWLRNNQVRIASAIGTNGVDLGFKGRDGTGRKTEIPWVRFASISHSPNAREGWYCVYLFHAKGEGFFLCLGHGSTRWENGEFKRRSPEELQTQVSWAREVLGSQLQSRKDLHFEIDLGARQSELGEAYADGTVVACWYPITNVPTDTVLLADALYFAKLLGRIYDAQDLGREPSAIPLEVANVAAVLDEISRPLARKKRSGQGYGLSPAERRIVERHAMELAMSHLTGKGWAPKDVSATESFDIEARREGAATTFVEVKGTTGAPSEIILTANEVALHRQAHPNNFLLVVHGINLDRSEKSAVASGGTVLEVHPWNIHTDDLTPTVYRYRVRKQDSST